MDIPWGAERVSSQPMKPQNQRTQETETILNKSKCSMFELSLARFKVMSQTFRSPLFTLPCARQRADRSRGGCPLVEAPDRKAVAAWRRFRVAVDGVDGQGVYNPKP